MKKTKVTSILARVLTTSWSCQLTQFLIDDCEGVRLKVMTQLENGRREKVDF